MFFTVCSSPLGTLFLISDGTSLTGLWPGPRNPVPKEEQRDDLSVFHSAKAWLSDYFSGRPRDVDFPLSPAGTEFQHRVWNLLLEIPYGETVTYGNLADQLGANMAPQAVGQAVGRNPIAIIIPCHRVVGARDRLTGYAWGTEKKKWLLRHEEENK